MKSLTAAAFGLAVSVVAVSQPQSAQAAGCGGYVNVFVSGCAPWDNNARRMPGAPGYVAPRPTTPAIATQQPRIVVQPQPTQRIATQPPTTNRLITDNGAGLISPGNRNPGLIANDGASLQNRSGILSDQGGGMRR